MRDEIIEMICEKAKERARLIDDIECKAIESRLAELGYVKERTCNMVTNFPKSLRSCSECRCALDG